MSRMLLDAPGEIVSLGEAIEGVYDGNGGEPGNPVSNRRADPRLKTSALSWLRGARIKYGSELRVLDLSKGGLLIETPDPLRPDANIIVELSSTRGSIVVPSRVLRFRVASLGEVLRYQGACAFRRPLTLPELDAKTGFPGAPAARPTTPVAFSWQKVIARYHDGRVLCGYTNNFHPSKPQLHLSPNPRHGDTTIVPLAQLKALFFVREFNGDPTLVERKAFVNPPQGRKVEVVFHDDEVLVGSTLGYLGEGKGFFVQPADSRSNNLRVFVSATGVKQVQLL